MKPLQALARKLLRKDGNDGTEDPEKLPLLLISGQPSDRKVLEPMLLETRWKLLAAGSFHEGLDRLRSFRTPVVLCDRVLPDSNWRQSLAALLSEPSPARVILLAEGGDHSLWKDVIEQGGFDVLTRPLRKTELIQTLDCALRLWQQGNAHESAAM